MRRIVDAFALDADYRYTIGIGSGRQPRDDDYTKERVRVSLGTNDAQIARALRDFLMQATPKIAANIPRVRGQAMPDLGTDVCESRAVRVPWMNQPHAQSAAV